MRKIFNATPTDKREQLAAQLEYSSILSAKAIKKQQKAVLEHRQRRPKILEVSIYAFQQCYYGFSIVIYMKLEAKGGFQATKKKPKYTPALNLLWTHNCHALVNVQH